MLRVFTGQSATPLDRGYRMGDARGLPCQWPVGPRHRPRTPRAGNLGPRVPAVPWPQPKRRLGGPRRVTTAAALRGCPRRGGASRLGALKRENRCLLSGGSSAQGYAKISFQDLDSEHRRAKLRVVNKLRDGRASKCSHRTVRPLFLLALISQAAHAAPRWERADAGPRWERADAPRWE